ncbi:MAG: cupredoxin domain-containing protein, partial [Chloroflexi bacterium]|nr:cupredoxin domain-containing protein [Chloroflexota bacterium]
MNRNRVRRASAITAVASFALVILAACGSPDEVAHEDVTRVPIMSEAAALATETPGESVAVVDAEGGEAPEADEAAPAADTGDESAAPAQTAEVVSYDIYFEPAEFSIPADTDVTVVLPNNGAAPHNFSIDELGIDVDIAPGATEETVINA